MSKQDYFRVVKDVIRPDSRGRLTLGQVARAKSYRVMVWSMMQGKSCLTQL
jgi:hypothetical protein